ncbi:unnamed protein product [Gongylonema pulchrum]|uniref:Nuclear receptor domain-containing protein n=1 Tax=Gongylonema pulchrum TaxID=637853 RepID=A0A3P6S3E2_9BILA|nr:unnamed protein product [Gongylonema pulchrum]
MKSICYLLQRKLEYKCKFDSQCEINKSTRNVCQYCRFQKCLENGMSTALVLNETERQAKRNLIQENRTKRELERIRALIKATSLSSRQEEFKATIDQITASYCRIIDVPLRVVNNDRFQKNK